MEKIVFEPSVRVINEGEEQKGMLTIKQVKGLDEVPPQKVSFSGIISAPSDYFLVKKQQQTLSETCCVVVMNESEKKITLYANPSDQYAPVIVGTVKESVDAHSFKINEPATFTREDLMKVIKFNRRFFAIREEYDKLLSALASFKVKTEIELEQGSDSRGNRNSAAQKRVNFERDAEGNERLPQNIKLALPLFHGGPDKAVVVEICVDTTEHTTRFWLESSEYRDAQRLAIENLFGDEFEKFTKHNVAVIRQ